MPFYDTTLVTLEGHVALWLGLSVGHFFLNLRMVNARVLKF